MKERDLKKLYFEWLLKNEASHTVVVNEFIANHWKRRADLLVVNGCIHLIEIKSKRDNLFRLEGQIDYFLGKGHKVTLVIDKKHKDKILNIPRDVGIFLVSDGELIIDREPRTRRIRTNILAEYWRLNELRMLFRGLIKGVYKMHIDKLQKLLYRYPEDIVSKLTCELLKARYTKYYSVVRAHDNLEIKRVAKNGFEDPVKDYPYFFKKAQKLLLPYGV